MCQLNPPIGGTLHVSGAMPRDSKGTWQVTLNVQGVAHAVQLIEALSEALHPSVAVRRPATPRETTGGNYGNRAAGDGATSTGVGVTSAADQAYLAAVRAIL